MTHPRDANGITKQCKVANEWPRCPQTSGCYWTRHPTEQSRSRQRLGDLLVLLSLSTSPPPLNNTPSPTNGLLVFERLLARNDTPEAKRSPPTYPAPASTIIHVFDPPASRGPIKMVPPTYRGSSPGPTFDTKQPQHFVKHDPVTFMHGLRNRDASWRPKGM